ncbi:MAG: ferredoxin family protein [Desulfatiglans sp.]|nr:ferredoxin family protein [Desulfatiglans sp.]
MAENNMIVYCKCTHRDLVSDESRDMLLKSLEQHGHDAVIVDDLCGLVSHNDPLLKAWVQYSKLIVIACYERAIQALFSMAEAESSPGSQIIILNPRVMPPEEIMSRVTSEVTGGSGGTPEKIAFSGLQEPWFPVIDRGRCQKCKLCFNFCLFGVYTIDEEANIRVSHPDNCKNNCAACARICPGRAIIFPKLNQPPFNGDEIDESKIQAPPVRLDLLNGTDIHSMLRNRGRQGGLFSAEPRKPVNMLEALHKRLDIPMSVLEGLSPSDLSRIQKRAFKAGDQDEK